MATKATTAWGDATLVEEVTLPQTAGGREFASVVQLLQGADGARYVRFAYTTDGTARRGPVTLRQDDVALLRSELAKCPELRSALGLTSGKPRGGVRRG